ncbi:MAG: hypothetical protein ACYDHW_00455 [Syntrophorhabdaceae bacterium]
MKKAAAIFIALPFLFLACTHMGKRPVTITWPENIQYMTALSEIDVMLKDNRYTGDMSLKVFYPHDIYLEVYSPFGTTILSVSRSEDHFSMRTDDQELTDENEFYRLFHVRVDDVIEDLTLHGQIETGENGFAIKQRPDYTVHYYLDNVQNKICWNVYEGKFCMTFIDVNFSREKPDGKSDSGRN